MVPVERSEVQPCPAQHRPLLASRIMTDHYVQVMVQQMKSLGEDAEKEGVRSEEQVPASPVCPEPPSIPAAAREESRASGQARKNRSRLGRADRISCGNSDLSLYSSMVSAHVARNLSRLEQERNVNVRGGGKVLQGKSETNGNYATIQTPKNTQDARREDGIKLARRRRPVTVDTAKAKTSLEALKISIKQLKWKEVCCMSLSLQNALCSPALQGFLVLLDGGQLVQVSSRL